MKIANRDIRMAAILAPLTCIFFLFQNFSVPYVDTSTQTQGAASFLIQDVCVDANNQPTIDDPYSCPYGMTRRNMRVGDNLTYQKHDKPDGANPLGFQSSASLPPLNSFYISSMNLVEGPALAYQVQFSNFNPRGFNVAKAGANWFSFVGTKDGSLPYTQGFFNTDCQLQDSWLLFKKDVLNLPAGVGASDLAIVWGAASCDKTMLPAVSYWPRANTQGLLEQAPLTYTSGKTMKTITSYHWGLKPDGTADHLEKFYFTDEYGLSRWERWQVGSGVENILPCNGPTKIGNLIRVDCRDWTYVKPLPDQLSVFSQFQMSTLFPDFNLIKDVEFRAVTDGPATALGVWKRISAASILNWAVTTRESDTNRRHIAFSCSGVCQNSTSGLKNALIQDYSITNISQGSHVHIGGTFWTDAPSASAELMLSQFASDGREITRSTIPMSLSSKKQSFSQRINLINGATKLRYAIYPKTNNGAIYRFRDGYMSAIEGSTPVKVSLSYARGFAMTSGQVLLTQYQKLVFQDNGDLCVFSTVNGQLLWCSNKGSYNCKNGSCKLEFGQDGNLCAFSQLSGPALWCSGTTSSGQAMILKNEVPYLRVVDSNNSVVWPK